MLALNCRFGQVAVTNEIFDGTEVILQVLGKRQGTANKP
jgi:hypothetical protein